MMCDEKIEPDAAKSMVKGQADRLDSAFHLGYNMIINLMRVEGISPEYMLERCFFQFQNTMSVPVLEKRESAHSSMADRQNSKKRNRSETPSKSRTKIRSRSTTNCANCSRRKDRTSRPLSRIRHTLCLS